MKRARTKKKRGRQHIHTAAKGLGIREEMLEEKEVDFVKHRGGGVDAREEENGDEEVESDGEKVLPGVVVVEEPVEDVDTEPDDRPDLAIGIFELNEVGGGGDSGSGKGFVIERFFLVEEAGRGEGEDIGFFDDNDDDRGKSDDIDGDVDMGEEDKKK